jgi:hypothetical protein
MDPRCARCGGELHEADSIVFLSTPGAWMHIRCAWTWPVELAG